MQQKLSRLIVKIKFFLPVGAAILVSITVITWQSIFNSKKSFDESLQKSLLLEVETISKMFEREYEFKMNNVSTNLKILNKFFYEKDFQLTTQKISIEAINQITGNKVNTQINNWKLDSESLYGNYNFVDEIQLLIGGTVTIFQKIDSGYVRISTNVLNSDSIRAVNTFISNNSPVVQAIEKGETYFGSAFVVNEWYITAYQPLVVQNNIVGMLFVGNKEKDLDELRKILNNLKIGNSGSVFVFDKTGEVIIHQLDETKNYKSLIKEILAKKNSVKNFISENNSQKTIVAYKYFDKFNIYIAAEIIEKEETSELINKIIKYSILIALLIIVILSLFIFKFTYERLYKYLNKIETTNKNLENTKLALNLSEEKFQTLFNNSSDEIYVTDLKGNFIEVNKITSETLGYTRDELLKMRFSDIKTEKYKYQVWDNLNIIKEKGKHTYETEHITKDGKIQLIEMKSRMIDYQGEKAIMTIARNINERKAMEKKIISTVIETEEKERKRFAADLHDGLGPILSTIKLYADLLKNKSNANTSKEELIQNIIELVDLAIASSKEISNNLTPTILHDFGLAVAINEFTNYINKTKSISIHVDTENYTLNKHNFEETILYQVTKELINNTLKHASAKSIKIELKNTDTQTLLYYRDDGEGFDFENMLQTGSGLGLTNIVNKIKTIKGTCDFNTQPGKGMFVLINVKNEN